MALENLSFETIDTTGGPEHPGHADAWTLTVVAAITIAGYALGGSNEQAWETFEEGWVDGYVFELGASTAAGYAADFFVTPPAYEDFLAGWALAFLTDLGATAAAEYGTGFDVFDEFLDGWTTPFENTLAIGTTAAPVDEFLTGWVTYVTTLGATSSASYGATGGSVAYEAFESVLAPVTFVPAPGSATLAAPAHPLTNGKRVQVRSTGRLPDGLGAGNYYFVVGATGGTFELSATSGGTGITPSCAGAGTHSVIPDGATEWELTTT